MLWPGLTNIYVALKYMSKLATYNASLKVEHTSIPSFCSIFLPNLYENAWRCVQIPICSGSVVLLFFSCDIDVKLSTAKVRLQADSCMKNRDKQQGSPLIMRLLSVMDAALHYVDKLEAATR
jgi:hypothetical protein